MNTVCVAWTRNKLKFKIIKAIVTVKLLFNESYVEFQKMNQ